MFNAYLKKKQNRNNCRNKSMFSITKVESLQKGEKGKTFLND